MAARILVVDDEPDMLALMKLILEDKNYEVIVTNNPLEVGELLERQKVDIVLTDLKMPGLDGIEVLSEVKRHDPEITVMIITAYGSLESAEEAIGRGAFDFITKPFRKEQVLLAVDKALRWREIVRQNEELRRKLEQK